MELLRYNVGVISVQPGAVQSAIFDKAQVRVGWWINRVNIQSHHKTDRPTRSNRTLDWLI